jgi:mannose-6-phosphate isomerase-like protein (cupin superfamily)
MHPVGTWFENTKTKELARLRVAPQDAGGERLVADLWLQPGAAVIGEHVHDHLDERFTVIAGRLSVRVDGVESTVGAGGSVEVPAGTGHYWWNDSDEAARVAVEITATPDSGPMAERFVEMIEVGFGLANTGHTNDEGRPSPLWLAAFAMEYRDVMVLSSPPPWVQRALFGPLSGLARRMGRDPSDPSLHWPGCPAEVPPPAGFVDSDEAWMPPG